MLWKMATEFTPDLIRAASTRISGAVHRTPVITSQALSDLSGFQVFLKAESLQKTGSFKARGALNAIKVLQESGEPLKGVVTHSSGNHGQALAWAARSAGVPCTVVVPKNAPKVKVAAIAGYGAKLRPCESTMKDRVETCQKVVEEEGVVLIHPHDDIQVMAGQGTIAMEFVEQAEALDAILVPTGGGGMVGGIATWVATASPSTKVYCVVTGDKDLETSLAAGEPKWVGAPQLVDTIADGIRPDRLGVHCFGPVARHCQKEVLRVSDEEVVSAMKMSWERLKLVLETSTGAGLAALTHPRLRELLGPGRKRVGVILCGGNVDLDHLPWLAKDA